MKNHLTPLLLACASAAALAQTPPRPLACTDFDRYVNQAWEERTEVPPSRARIGSFDELRITGDRVLEEALQRLVAQPQQQGTPGLKLLAVYYQSGMDEAAMERQGLRAAQPLLQRINALSRDTLSALLGEMAGLQIDAPLQLRVGPDTKDQTRHTLFAMPAGLGLPDRDDYTRDDANTRRITTAYRLYAQQLLRAAGVDADEAAINAVLALEARMAQATLTRVERRDPQRVYNPSTLAQVRELAPGFDGPAYFAAAGLAPQALHTQSFILSQPGHLQALGAAMAEVPLPAWRNYLRIRLLDAMAQVGPAALREARFAYQGKAISGLREAPPRSEQVIRLIGGGTGSEPLGEALGELFVRERFSPLAQARSLQMVADIREAMHKRIGELAWMSEPTKAAARAKLAAMVAKIGAPAQWRSYPGLALSSDDFAGNRLRVAAWHWQQRLAELAQPVDRQRWFTSPHIVNAFAAAGNTIVFPAGILQPPFFDERADDASNYGGIGMVIGHEITHHFDDRGRQFDAVGNLRDWWSSADAAAYRARAERVAQLYSSFEPTPGVFINGWQTLGENISDFGGIQIAFEGLQIALQRQQQATGKAPALVDGHTPAQRFFMANALIWRNKMRVQALVNQLRTGSHSPGRYRILGPMQQMSAFAQAFGCEKGDAMVAAQPIVVW